MACVATLDRSQAALCRSIGDALGCSAPTEMTSPNMTHDGEKNKDSAFSIVTTNPNLCFTATSTKKKKKKLRNNNVDDCN